MKGCAYLLMMEKVLYFDLFLFYFIFIFISFYFIYLFLKNKGVGSFRYTETKKRKFDDYTVNNNSRPSVNKKKHK